MTVFPHPAPHHNKWDSGGSGENLGLLIVPRNNGPLMKHAFLKVIWCLRVDLSE